MEKFKWVPTEDGSQTLFFNDYNEACHNLSGASSETIYNFIEGCEINQRTKDDITILEVGFGTGLGFLETLKHSQKKFHFISLELHEDILLLAKERYPELKELKKKDNHYELKTDKFHLEILLGNARETVKTISTKIDAIYQDAFSPKRNPELWTTQWFSDLKNISQSDCILSTYSSSVSIRKALIEAGWVLENRKGFGNKKLATIAKLRGNTDPEIILRLERSPVSALEDSAI